MRAPRKMKVEHATETLRDGKSATAPIRQKRTLVPVNPIIIEEATADDGQDGVDQRACGGYGSVLRISDVELFAQSRLERAKRVFAERRSDWERSCQ